MKFKEKLLYCLANLGDTLPVIAIDGGPKNGKTTQAQLFVQWLSNFIPEEKIAFINNNCNAVENLSIVRSMIDNVELSIELHNIVNVDATMAFINYQMMLAEIKNEIALGKYTIFIVDPGYCEFELCWANKINQNKLLWFKCSPLWDNLFCNFLISEENETIKDRGILLTEEEQKKNDHNVEYVNSIYNIDENAFFVAEKPRVLISKLTKANIEQTHSYLVRGFEHIIDYFYRHIFNENNRLHENFKVNSPFYMQESQTRH